MGKVGKFFKTQSIALAVGIALLTLENARSGDGGNAHSIAHEQDDVARLRGVRLQLLRSQSPRPTKNRLQT